MGEPDTRHILFLPGTSSERIVAGELRGYGWDGRVPAAEAAELCRLRRAVIIPDDFPRLSPPAKEGEALKAYIARAIAGHPLIAGFTALSVGLNPVRLLVRIRPEQWTREWWQTAVQGGVGAWRRQRWHAPRLCWFRRRERKPAWRPGACG